MATEVPTNMIQLQELDLAERGECSRRTSMSENRCSSSGTLTGNVTPSLPVDDEQPTKDIPLLVHSGEQTGRTGSARSKQSCREWCFFPACEQQFSLVLDYWAAKSWGTYHEVKVLEQRNREEGLDDYKKHRPDNGYGERKELLMDQLTKETKTFLTVFNLANGVMLQHSPSATVVNDYKQWAYINLSPSVDPTDREFSANNYRALGARPSMIDEVVHSAVKRVWYSWTPKAMSYLNSILPKSYARKTQSTETALESLTLNYPLLHALSHISITILAIIFFVFPLTILYLVPMSVLGSVALAVAFSIVFCVGSFWFGGGGLRSDYKLLLLFAYLSVMATLLSNLAQHQQNIAIVGSTEVP